MRGMHLKLITTLIVAGLVPLLLGLISLQWFGRKSYLSQQGQMFQSAAEYTAEGLADGLEAAARELIGWISLSELPRQLQQQNAETQAAFDPAGLDAVEHRWVNAKPTDPLVADVLGHPTVRHLRHFQWLDPLMVEILLTDREGRIVAGTNKSSDYWQADEQWWQVASTLPASEAWIGGIDFDESAAVYAVSVAVPVYSEEGFEGVLKSVVNASPLLASIAPPWREGGPRRELVQEDGRILVRLNERNYSPFSEQFGRLPEGRGNGWELDESPGGTLRLLGFAEVGCTECLPVPGITSEVNPMLVVVHHPFHTVLAPMEKLLFQVTVVGLTMVTVFGLLGYYVASNKLVRPISALRRAAREIAETARLDPAGPVSGDGESRRRAEKSLEKVDQIATGDELQVLAKDFGLMSRRVLDYHEQMQREISSKTEEIQQDLVMARHFQEALLPESIPPIPRDRPLAGFQLRFSHVYKPALSVSGDFFDVHNLGEHTAGVFIADVMGHGARSALVTAILHTMLQEVEERVPDPADVLRLINQRFSRIAERADETLFVTAFYMCLDARSGEIHYASAGHPSPLVVSRSLMTVGPLLEESDYGMGLGLQADSEYRSLSRPMVDGDTIFLFTDGVTEAMNPDGEEFGDERLNAVLLDLLQHGEADLAKSVMQALHAFMDTEPSHDDVCIVSAGITAAD